MPIHHAELVARLLLNNQFLQTMDWSSSNNAFKPGALGYLLRQLDDETTPLTKHIEAWNPMLLSTKANSEDNPTWAEAMNGPFKEGYWDACVKELHTLEKLKDAWEIVDREEWMNALPSTWAFKCKRFPDGSMRKLKARFCAGGHRQVEGIDFFETWAPVIKWQTVRMMLILTSILDLKTTQVDYTAAFLHAPIDRDPNWENMTQQEKDRSGVYVRMPQGFAQPGKAYKLKKSLYGLKQSPKNFFNFIKEKFQQAGLIQQVEVDPCLVMSDNVIVLLYVDDTIFISP